MVTSLVIEHQDFAGLARFGDWFADAGLDVETVRPSHGERVPGEVGHDALIVLGGSMGANDDANHPWLADTKTLMREYVAAEVPCLGICLGHQLLAVAMGGVVAKNPAGQQKGVFDVGLRGEASDDPLFSALSPSVVATHWNDDVVTELPESAVLLATANGGSTQAMRVGRSAWGVQFHPEADSDLIATWQRLSEETPDDGVVDVIREAEPSLRKTWSAFARRFAELAGSAAATREDRDVRWHRG